MRRVTAVLVIMLVITGLLGCGAQEAQAPRVPLASGLLAEYITESIAILDAHLDDGMAENTCDERIKTAQGKIDTLPNTYVSMLASADTLRARVLLGWYYLDGGIYDKEAIVACRNNLADLVGLQRR
jgi:hypothetical protein